MEMSPSWCLNAQPPHTGYNSAVHWCSELPEMGDLASLIDLIAPGALQQAVALPHLGGCKHVRFGPVDPNGNLCAGRAELLEEAAVRPDPQVIFSDLHLARSGKNNTMLG